MFILKIISASLIDFDVGCRGITHNVLHLVVSCGQLITDHKNRN